ncbi:MAG: type 1 glutamine amidotransferase [Elusimicrobia bacterium]|nr:type 1 glutamine amidotransferase [Elusimicrobiota bacterium]
MKTAWQLYAAMLKKYLAQAKYKVWFPCDTAEPPDGLGPAHYRGILWTGCNLTIYHLDDQRVRRQIEFAKRSYEAGAPAFGTCWGLQMAAVAAGGQVKANPKGREMGLARKIHLTKAGLTHPMMKDKPPVFCGFISHLDEVVKLPKGADLLATNDFTRVQAISVRHKKGLFWATQYHPEYNLHDMARLLTARSKKLLAEGFFTEKKDLTAYIAKLETLHQNPRRKDLRWQLDIDDDVLSQNIRQLEFANWLELALNVE